LPGFAPADVADLHLAITQIDRRLDRTHPARLGARALVGYSLGGFETLCIASEATAALPLLQFDRYLSIDSPVQLLQSISVLDSFYDAPLAWPPDERDWRIQNAFLKVAAMIKAPSPSEAAMAFSGTESKFLVGAVFRLILRDTIYTSQAEHNQGVLQQPIQSLHREQLYREIIQYSFDDYNRRFVIPYYQSRGLQGNLLDSISSAGNLHSYAGQLTANSKVRLIANENDFLLAPADRDWLHANFGPERLTTFPHGGHLGNLAQPDVQQAILKALDGLK